MTNLRPGSRVAIADVEPTATVVSVHNGNAIAEYSTDTGVAIQQVLTASAEGTHWVKL